MKRNQMLGLATALCTVLFLVGCGDDSDGSSSGGTPSASACADVCAKAVECQMYSSEAQCTSECTSEATSSEISCVSSCDETAACTTWFTCVEPCLEVEVVEGNGEYCEGYEIGSDADECCQTNDPCDWGDDYVCDCGGTCAWDAGDCSK
ncbi:MAG: hypothetical protein JXR45_21795 [Deltaproteobacteria bacterium]|nr:hypothetical protein [Deltaproteobacteria bacterium]